MVMIALFGQTEVGPQAIAEPPPAAITPQRFAEMAPHVRQELVLLMGERGMARRDIATLLAVPPGEVDALAASRHQFGFFKQDRTPGGGKPKRSGLPGNAAKVLKLIHGCGGELQMALGTIELTVGISPGSATEALRALRERGLVRCAAHGGGRRASIWALTEQGQALADETFAEAADA